AHSILRKAWVTPFQFPQLSERSFRELLRELERGNPSFTPPPPSRPADWLPPPPFARAPPRPSIGWEHKLPSGNRSVSCRSARRAEPAYSFANNKQCAWRQVPRSG